MNKTKTRLSQHGYPMLRIKQSCSNGTVDFFLSRKILPFGFYFSSKIHILLPGNPTQHLLYASVAIIWSWFSEGSQDIPWDPSFCCWWMVIGWLVHKEHVLLVYGKYLDHLTLVDTDFILLQCIVILDDHHRRGPIAPTQVILRKTQKARMTRQLRHKGTYSSSSVYTALLSAPGCNKTLHPWKLLQGMSVGKILQLGLERKKQLRILAQY